MFVAPVSQDYSSIERVQSILILLYSTMLSFLVCILLHYDLHLDFGSTKVGILDPPCLEGLKKISSHYGYWLVFPLPAQMFDASLHVRRIHFAVRLRRRKPVKVHR